MVTDGVVVTVGVIVVVTVIVVAGAEQLAISIIIRSKSNIIFLKFYPKISILFSFIHLLNFKLSSA